MPRKDHTLCRVLLAETRKDLEGTKIPKISTYKTSFRDYWEARLGGVLWEGSAHCGWEARAKAIAFWVEKTRKN